MKKLQLLLSLLFLSFIAYGQAGIQGNLSDSTTGLPVKLATVSVIRASDSMLVAFSRSDGKGDFQVNVGAPGNYLVLFAHPSFASYIENVLLGNEMKNLGNRYVITRTEMLERAIVRQKGNIFIKGDTLEYLLDSVKLDESANVEDLLKVLPGMEVDKDGNITAQGEKVEKVLVDGEEFFGNDPTMVTRNLNANIVDKVQVYEKKTEQSEFTGIDDGNSAKTIDIKLKEDMNKGTFGKVALHGGTRRIYDNFAMLNSFKGKRKVNLYGILSSNGEAGINWGDMQKYGMSTQRTFTQDGMMIMLDDNINYYGEGLPKVYNIGTNYINKWNDKHELKIGGAWRRMDLLQEDSSYTNNYFSSEAFSNINRDSSYGSKQRFEIFGEYKWDIDSMTSFGVNANASRLDAKKENKERLSNVLLGTGQIVSSNFNNNNNHDTTDAYNTEIYLKRKFHKVGRTISLYYNQNSNQKNFLQNKELKTNYNGDINNSTQLVSGYNSSKTNGGRIVYTEALYKESWLLELSMNYQNTINKANYKTQAAPLNGGSYLTYDSLSNDFLFEQNMVTPGINVQYKDKKIQSTLGGNVGYGTFNKTDYLRPQNSQSYTRINFFPTFRFRYSFTQFKQLRVRYSGSTNQPSIEQLQPNYDYSNPLQIVKGNPGLNQEYRQSINANFWNYDAFKDRSFWLGFNFSNTFNNISSITSFDTTLGRSISSYDNLGTSSSFNQWIGGSFKLKNTKYTIRPAFSSNFFSYPFSANGITGTSKTSNLSPSISIDYDIEKKLNAAISIDADYTNTKSELRNLSNSYWTFEPSLDITYRPVDFIRINTEVSYMLRQKTPPFLTNFTRTLWNAYIAGFLDQDKRIELKLTAHDILNQNNGYARTANSNIVNERYYLTIKRYFLIGITYNFARGPIAKKQNPGGEEENGHW